MGLAQSAVAAAAEDARRRLEESEQQCAHWATLWVDVVRENLALRDHIDYLHARLRAGRAAAPEDHGVAAPPTPSRSPR